MELALDRKNGLNQISLTGVRAIILIGILSIAPRSFKEIKQNYIKYGVMDESQSDDIIRIDMNTIKLFGCKILRSSLKTQYKYVLIKHPFTINITESDVKILRRLFDKIKNTMPVFELLEFDELLKKISKQIYDESIKEAFCGISPLKYYNTDILKELIAACANNYTIKLNYQKSYSKTFTEKNIVAHEMVFKNDKLYLYGYDLDKKASVTLLFNRIKSVNAKCLTERYCVFIPFVVKFCLKDYSTDLLTSEEKILNDDTDNCIIEGKYFNEFVAIQRILSFGSKCTVVEPAELKNKIISKLKEMRKMYDKE